MSDIPPPNAIGSTEDSSPWTPLHQAVETGTLEEVGLLIQTGADLEAVDSWKRTPFLLSVEGGDLAKAACLLAHGANCHARGHCEKPAIHYPIYKDDVRMMQWLISQGFEVDLEDEFGDTALKHAVEDGAPGCFRVLLEAGANWREPDSFGDPLIRLATHPEIISALIALGQDAAKLEAEPLREWIGLGTLDHLPVSREEFPFCYLGWALDLHHRQSGLCPDPGDSSIRNAGLPAPRGNIQYRTCRHPRDIPGMDFQA